MKNIFFTLLIIILFEITLQLTYSQNFLNEWDAHSGAANTVIFSLDGQKVLTCGNDGTVRIFNTLDNSPYSVIQSKNKNVKRLILSHNGDKFAICGSDNYIEVYSYPQCNLLKIFVDTCNAICFSYDDKIISCYDRLKIWDITTGINLKSSSIPFSNNIIMTKENGKVLLAGNDSKIYLYDYNTSSILKIYQEHIGPILGLSLSPDGSKFASSSADRTIRIWDINSTTSLKVGFAHLGKVYSINYSPDGTKLVTACEDTRVRLYRTDPIDVLHTYWDHVGEVYYATFSPNGQKIVSIGEDGLLRYWDTKEDSYLLLESISTHTGIINNIEYSPDGYSLITSGLDNNICIWDPVFGFLIKKINGHNDYITSLHYFKDASTAISSCKDGRVKIWDLNSGKSLVNINNNSSVLSLCFNTNYSKIFLSDSNGFIKVYDSKGILLKQIDNNNIINSLVYSIKNNSLITGDIQGKINVFDADNYTLKNTYNISGEIKKIVLSSDENIIYILNDDNKITELSLVTGQIRSYVNANFVTDFILHKDKIIIVEKELGIKLVRTFDFSNVGQLNYSNGYPIKVAISPDGNYLALGGWGLNNIKIKEFNTILSNNEEKFLSNDFYIYPNYPNPFNPTTNIKFYTPDRTSVTFEVYDILGRRIHYENIRDVAPGYHIIKWNPNNNSGGVYFYIIKNEKISKSGKMIYLK